MHHHSYVMFPCDDTLIRLASFNASYTIDALFQLQNKGKEVVGTIYMYSQTYVKIVSEYDKKYHNHKLQTNLWHREEERHNNHETPRRQTKQSNQLSLLHQDDSKTRMDIKQRTTKQRTITDSHKGSNMQQQVKNNRTTA